MLSRGRQMDVAAETLKKAEKAYKAKDHDNAIKFAEEVARLVPKSSLPHSLMGMVAIDRKDMASAMKHFEIAVRLEPQIADNQNNMGYILIAADWLEEALQYLEKAAELAPDRQTFQYNLADAYSKIARPIEAAERYMKALALKPDDKHLQLEAASSLTHAGRNEEAEVEYRKLLGDSSLSRRSSAMMGISACRKFKAGDPLIAETRQLLAIPNLDKGNSTKLHYALAKMLDDAGEHIEAFDHYLSARLNAIEEPFNVDEFTKLVDVLIETFNADFLKSRKSYGFESDRPVFVIGMPRSGTTLTEQILASHPLCYGAGELSRIPRLAKSFSYAVTEAGAIRFRDKLQSAPPEAIKELGESYIKLIDYFSPTAKRVIDKLPHNFMHAGFISLILPNARFIHSMRDPIDNCVSIFMNPLSAKGHAYAGRLETLGRYYRQYHRLMEHWYSTLGDRILKVNYEDTTADIEGSARQMIDFIGLPWDEACLRFYEGERNVQTISKWQVRQPVYRSSVQRWKRYGEKVNPLIDALGDLAAT